MAHPTDIYVALSDAPAGIEDTFQFFKPTAERDGQRLVLLFDVPTDVASAGTLRGEVAMRLKGCEYYYAELDDSTGYPELLYDAGDIRHVRVPEVDEPTVAHSHVFVAAWDLTDDELASLREQFPVRAVYERDGAVLVHIADESDHIIWDGTEQSDVLYWPELQQWLFEVGSTIDARHGYDDATDDPEAAPLVWCAASNCGQQAGDWEHPLWSHFGMQVERSFAVTFQ